MDKTKKRINLNNQFLEQAVFAIADGYCSINLTKDLVPGVMHQVVDGVDYDLNEQLGMPENSSFSELVKMWALTIPKEERKEFLEILNREKLLERFYKGEQHITFNYWTRTVKYESMFAEHHMAIFEDEETEDVLAVNYVLDRTEQYHLEQYKKELEQKNKELERLLKREKNYNNKIYRDALTGVFNRRYYEEVVKNSVEDAGIALMDLDDFKVSNDTYGHHVGDVALKTAAEVILSCIGEEDILIRYGGDEFLLILSDIREEDLKNKLNQIRDKVRNVVIPGYSYLHLSLSIGGTIKTKKDAIKDVVCYVDQLMYQAKNKKDEVVVYQDGEKHYLHASVQENMKQQILIVDDSIDRKSVV